MIKLEQTSVMNMENAIRAIRNPLNSWDKSDSKYSGVLPPDSNYYEIQYVIGDNDLALAKKLANAGSDHRKFLRQILVSVCITAPFYWWKEFDTYKVGTVANSCSTMHTIHTQEFTLKHFSWELLNEPSLQLLEAIIDMLNYNRKMYLETKNKNYWYQMIQLLPTSYNQFRTVTLNYEVLRNMYHARKQHKLDEWREFCKWIESLPYSELITEEENNDLPEM